jgi:hypothetical protein
MGKTLTRLIRAKMKAQGGLCYYCGQPMWEEGLEAFARAQGLSLGRAVWFRCTAEHLVARCDGGRDVPGNIVAACLFCNRTRHAAKVPRDRLAYKARVQRRMVAGRWLRLG